MLCAGRYSLLEQDSLDDLLPIALDRSVSVILGGAFNSGLLIAPGPGSTYNYAPAPPELIKPSPTTGGYFSRVSLCPYERQHCSSPWPTPQ